MAVVTKEILPLVCWVFILGISIFTVSKVIGKVNDKLGEVFIPE